MLTTTYEYGQRALVSSLDAAIEGFKAEPSREGAIAIENIACQLTNHEYEYDLAQRA